MHKWLALVVGVQVAIWTLTGLYMTVVHIDTIHGDHFIRDVKPAPVDLAALASPIVVARAGGADTVRLASVLGQPVYVLAARGRETLVDARSGKPLPAPTRQQVRDIATRRYSGTQVLEKLELITAIPGEIRGRKPPLWRADFSGWNKPTLYISPATGELVSRRHGLWRIFDFAWMLHIMDYDERENVNNWLLRVMTLAALATALAGAWLLFFAFGRRRRRATGG